ncbi:MAG: TonB-dependent siderophore receptor [Rhodanobacteraceae bacterium]|nr:MAG: TonB-dependent siderophore receptor [Rhodanobacteraceae bacterium]
MPIHPRGPVFRKRKALPLVLSVLALAVAASPTARAADGAAAGLTQLPTIRVVGNVSPYQVSATATATRTDTPLLDIPQAIQALPIQLLRDQAANTLGDAMRNAPGVSVAQGEGNRDQLVIRGVSTKSDFFIDGVRDDSEYFRDLYNLSEVDVLQGPAALLFGRGNSGGLVNLVTKQPERASIHALDVDAGGYGFARGTVDLGTALGDNAAFRINAMAQRNGGDFSFRNDYFEHRYGVDPEFKFWFGNDTTLEFGVSGLAERQIADRGVPSMGNRPVAVPRGTFFGSPDQNHVRISVGEAHARMTHAFSDQLQFSDTLRISRTNHFYQNMYPGSGVDAGGTFSMKGYYHGNGRTSVFNHADLTYTADTGAIHHQLLTGIDIGYQRDGDYKVNAQTINDVPLADPVVVGAFNAPSRDNTARADFVNVYAQDQLSFGSHWKALLGVAWERFNVRARYLLLPPGTATRHTDVSFTPRVGLIYQPVPNDSLYASVSRTFTPQGANLSLSLKSPAGADLAAETATNYEIGNKLDLLGGNLSLTAAVFQLNLKNILNTDPLDPSVFVLTGAQRNRGFEFTARGNLTSHLSLAANYAYVDARITSASTDGPAGAIAGLVPYNQASLWTRYAINNHWGFGGGVLGRSRAFTSFSNAVVLPGFARADAMAYYQTPAYRIQLNLRNLLDRRYYATANGDNQIMPGAPREVSVSFRTKF